MNILTRKPCRLHTQSLSAWGHQVPVLLWGTLIAWFGGFWLDCAWWNSWQGWACPTFKRSKTIWEFLCRVASEIACPLPLFVLVESCFWYKLLAVELSVWTGVGAACVPFLWEWDGCTHIPFQQCRAPPIILQWLKEWHSLWSGQCLGLLHCLAGC